MPTMTDVTHGALFAGYDGLGLAVEQALGARTVWVSDNDKAASKVLAPRLPGVPNLGDITRIDWREVPRVTILSGGFPCQDVRHAGRRAGLIRGKTRTGLWAHMLTAIDRLRPALVVAENVRGLLSARADSDVEPCPWCVGDEPNGALRALGAVLGDLADVGYDAEWVGLPASGVGACHGRFRVFIAAHPRGEAGELWAGLRASIAGGIGGRRPGDDDSAALLTLLPTPCTTDANGAGAPEGQDYRGASLTDATVRQSNRWAQYAEAIARHERIYGPAPAPTQPGRNGRPRLSPKFDEWMMCLPAGWVTDVPGLSIADQLKLLGNGVVPPQAVAALHHLARCA